MRTTNYSNTPKPKLTRQQPAQKLGKALPKIYTGTKSTSELRSAMAISSTTRPVDYYNM